MYNKLRQNRILRLIMHAIIVLTGNFLLAIGVQSFAIPAKIIVGGASGMSIVIGHFIPVSLSYSVLVINIVALILGLIFLGKRFIVGTIVSTFAFPLFLEFVAKTPSLNNLTNDRLLAAMFAGALQGIGVGIVFRVGYSTGGLDIPPLIINKYTSIPVGTVVYIVDIIILLAQIPFVNMEGILYGIINAIISGYCIDKAMMIGESNIQVTIISTKPEELVDMIFNEIDRGATYLNITTGYFKKDTKAVMVVCSRRQVTKLQERIQKIDPNAFVITNEVHSVKGRGFTLPSIDL